MGALATIWDVCAESVAHARPGSSMPGWHKIYPNKATVMRVHLDCHEPKNR